MPAHNVWKLPIKHYKKIMPRKKGDPYVGKEKVTDYNLDGKPIVLARKRGRPRVIRNPLFIPMEKKLEVAAWYTVLGDIPAVAKKSGFTEKQIREWKEEPWFEEVSKKIMLERNEGQLSTINTVIEQSLAMLEDRILNGDVVYTPARIGRDGELICEEATHRVPIKGRDLGQIFSHLTKQKQLMQNQPTSITSAQTTDNRLELLKQHFEQLTKGTVLDGQCKEIGNES